MPKPRFMTSPVLYQYRRNTCRQFVPGKYQLYKLFSVCLFVCLPFAWLHLRHMEVPGPGAELEMQLLAYTTATATSDLSSI